MASTQPSRTDTAARGMSILNTVALILLIVGGLNWALVGLFDFDLVAALFGDMSPLSRIVYVLVGIAALIAFGLFGRARRLHA
jgi:uncharacterized protein